MSPTWRAVVLLASAGGSALVVPPEVAGIVVVVVLAATAVDAWSVRRAPEVVRRVPRELARGVAAPFSVEVGARPSVRVEVRQPQTADVRVDPPEGPDGIAGDVVALRRGRHVLEPVVTRSTGPLGLARWVHRHGDRFELEVHVDLPAARRLAASVRAGTFRDPGARRGPLGLGTDFESVREYTPDDDIRRVNWLATERVGRPMVNQYREDSERDLWCLVDTGRLLAAPVGERTRLDAALDAVAAVAAVADAVGDRVGTVVFDRQVHRVVRPRRASAAGLVRLLDDLEPVTIDSDYAAAFGRVGAAKRALVMVFTDLLDRAAAEPLLDAVPVLTRHHAVVVAGTWDPDLVAAVTAEPTDRRRLLEASVATELLAERDEVRTRLGAMGAVVVDAPVEDLSSSCVAAYLRLKSTARL